MAFADQILDVDEIDGGFWSFNPTMDDFEYDDDAPIDAGTNQRHKSATSDFVCQAFCVSSSPTRLASAGLFFW